MESHMHSYGPCREDSGICSFQTGGGLQNFPPQSVAGRSGVSYKTHHSQLRRRSDREFFENWPEKISNASEPKTYEDWKPNSPVDVAPNGNDFSPNLQAGDSRDTGASELKSAMKSEKKSQSGDVEKGSEKGQPEFQNRTLLNKIMGEQILNGEGKVVYRHGLIGRFRTPNSHDIKDFVITLSAMLFFIMTIALLHSFAFNNQYNTEFYPNKTNSDKAQDSMIFIVASFGGAAALVFGKPTDDMSQPYPLFLGHMIGGLLGIGTSLIFGKVVGINHSELPALALYIVGTVCLQKLLRAWHPPGISFGMIMILGNYNVMKQKWLMLGVPGAAGCAILIIYGLIFNNLRSYEKRHYPAWWV